MHLGGYLLAVDLHSPPVIAGRYALLDPIGAGATSRVFRARDRLLERTVAVKVLRPCDDEVAAARLRDEAVIASGLNHPGIARVFDYGEAEVEGELRPYLTMELVEGMTLRQALRGGPLPPDHVLDLIAQVASALAHAHDAGVVHRDVKPGNIMLTPDGRAVLLDFGIARRAGIEPLTLTGMIVGTVDYLSAEQASGRSATPLSDLYSLGCVAYEALTGTRPFKRDTLAETLAAHASSEAPPLPDDIPPGVRALVEQLVRRDPAERPADAATVAALALRPAAALPPRSPRPIRSPSRRRSRILAANGAAAAVAALAAVVLSGQVEPESSPAAAAASRPLTTASTPASTTASTPATSHAVVRVAPPVRQAPQRRTTLRQRHVPRRAAPTKAHATAAASPTPAAPTTPTTTPTRSHGHDAPPQAGPPQHPTPPGHQDTAAPSQPVTTAPTAGGAPTSPGNGKAHGDQP